MTKIKECLYFSSKDWKEKRLTKTRAQSQYETGQQPGDICQRAISAANLNGADIILFDTAGRTQIDLQMMSEIKQIEKIINPSETF